MDEWTIQAGPRVFGGQGRADGPETPAGGVVVVPKAALATQHGRIRGAQVHIQRARDAAGAPDTAIPPHRATVVRQNLRFAADLLAREV